MLFFVFPYSELTQISLEGSIPFYHHITCVYISLAMDFYRGGNKLQKNIILQSPRIRKTCFSYKISLLALGASEQILYTNIFLIDHYQNNCSLPKLLKNEFGACETGRGGKRGGGGSDELAPLVFQLHVFIYMYVV